MSTAVFVHSSTHMEVVEAAFQSGYFDIRKIICVDSLPFCLPNVDGTPRVLSSGHPRWENIHHIVQDRLQLLGLSNENEQEMAGVSNSPSVVTFRNELSGKEVRYHFSTIIHPSSATNRELRADMSEATILLMNNYSEIHHCFLDWMNRTKRITVLFFGQVTNAEIREIAYSSHENEVVFDIFAQKSERIGHVFEVYPQTQYSIQTLRW